MMNAFMDLPIIDCHTHIVNLDDIQKLTKVMQEFGLDKLNIMSISAYKKEYIIQNLICGLFKALNQGKCYGFGGLYHPFHGCSSETMDYVSQAKRLIEMGFDGIKMIEGKPDARRLLGEPLDSMMFDEYFSYLERDHIPLLFHVADPAAFWDREKVPESAIREGWFYGDGSFLSKDSIYHEVEGVLRKFPKLKVIFAHFYFMSEDVIAASEFLDRWSNVNIDITPGSEMYGDFSKSPRQWRDFFIKYQDRILFGTDNESGDSENCINTIRTFLETDSSFKYWGLDIKGIGLEKQVLDKIYYGNFQRLVGRCPKQLDLQLLTDEYYNVCRMVENHTYDCSVKNQLAEIKKMLDKLSV